VQHSVRAEERRGAESRAEHEAEEWQTEISVLDLISRTSSSRYQLPSTGLEYS